MLPRNKTGLQRVRVRWPCSQVLREVYNLCHIFRKNHVKVTCGFSPFIIIDLYKFLCYLGTERKELIGKSSFCQDSWDWRAISPGRWRPLPCCSAVPWCTVEMGLREAGGHVKLGMGHSWVHPHTAHNHVWTAPIGSPGSRDKVALSILHMYALPFLQPVFWKKSLVLHWSVCIMLKIVSSLINFDVKGGMKRMCLAKDIWCVPVMVWGSAGGSCYGSEGKFETFSGLLV